MSSRSSILRGLTMKISVGTKLLEKLTYGLLFVMIVLMSTGTFFKFGGIPAFAFPWVLAFIGVFLLWITRRDCFSSLRPRARRRIILFLVTWLMYGLCQFAFVALNSEGERYFTFLVFNVTSFILVIVMGSDLRKVQLINRAILGGLVLNLIVAFWELRTNHHIVPLSLDYERRFYAIPLTFFPNANDFATFLVGGVATISNEMVLARNRFYRVVLWLLAGCTLYVMTKTQSRGGMLGVLVFCLVYFLLRIARHLSKQSKALFVSTLILILVSFLVFILALDSYFFGKIYHDVVTTEDRLYLWNQALDLFVESNLLGIGPGQCLRRMGNVHFVFLELLAEYGLAIILGVMLIVVALVVWTHPFYDTKINSLVMAFMVAFLPTSMSSSSMTRITIMWIVVASFYALKINGCDLRQQRSVDG